MSNDKNKISIEKAHGLLNNIPFKPTVEKVGIEMACNKYIAEDLVAQIAQPPFARSPFDGYALNSRATKSALKDNPAKLYVNQIIYAGMVPEKSIQESEAARIMTGAPIPEGADCIIKQEDCIVDNHDNVLIPKVMNHKQNYIEAGEDVSVGTTLLTKGTLLNYAGIAALVSQGIDQVSVYKKPKITILSSGDEVIEPGQTLAPGKIYNSNIYSLAARLKELNYEVKIAGNNPDSEEIMKDSFAEELKGTDVLITVGGVSVGDKDFSGKVLKSLGADILFDSLDHKPGGSIICGTLNDKIVFCLSGNPGAATISLELVVRPYLEKLSSNKQIEMIRCTGVLEEDYTKSRNVRRFARGHYYIENSKCILTLSSRQSPGIMSSFLNSNCIADIPEGTESLKAGSEIEFIII